MDTKICLECKIEKPVSEFYKQKRRPDGSIKYHPRCRQPCQANYHKEILRKRRENNTCSVNGCESGAYKLKPITLCSMHWRRLYEKGEVGQVEPLVNRGNGWISQGYKYIYVNGKPIREHRYVVEQSLGRELLPQETVHHINGDKLDNRLENLELWNSSHPAGQRIEDKIAWAEEILTLYAPDKLRS